MRRATVARDIIRTVKVISIHALREESDKPVDYAVLEIHNISIHALREESDSVGERDV